MSITQYNFKRDLAQVFASVQSTTADLKENVGELKSYANELRDYQEMAAEKIGPEFAQEPMWQKVAQGIEIIDSIVRCPSLSEVMDLPDLEDKRQI